MTATVKVISSVNKAQAACFNTLNARPVTCVVSTPVNNAWRFNCPNYQGGKYSGDVRIGWKDSAGRQHPGYPPGFMPVKTFFIPATPLSHGAGIVADSTAFVYWAAGFPFASWTPGVWNNQFYVEGCSGGDAAGLMKSRLAGLTETAPTILFSDGCTAACGSPGYNAKGFAVGAKLDDGTLWINNALVVSKLNAFLATYPTRNGCRAYPCS